MKIILSQRESKKSYSSLRVELADTPELQKQGLMFRKHLPENSGMLFKFDNPQVVNCLSRKRRSKW